MTDLDEALARFQQTGLEFGGGLANHGPMAAEALDRLGHAALIQGLVDVYAPRLPECEIGRPLGKTDLEEALGRPERLPDWLATFETLVEERPWREVLAIWLPALLRGLFAGATHGLLRTAHAVRALAADDSATRRRELAFGLAYWAGRFQPLPGVPGAGRRGVETTGPARGLAFASDGAPDLVVVPPAERRPGLFFRAVEVLDVVPEFARRVEGLSFGADADADLHELCRAGAALYLANPHARIAYVHCVTAPSALRLLAPHVDPRVVRDAIGYAAQAVMALHAVSAGPASTGPSAEVEKLALDSAEIRYRAACSLEEHAIKLAEACLREDEARSDPVFSLAAADAAVHLDSGMGRGAAC